MTDQHVRDVLIHMGACAKAPEGRPDYACLREQGHQGPCGQSTSPEEELRYRLQGYLTVDGTWVEAPFKVVAEAVRWIVEEYGG